MAARNPLDTASLSIPPFLLQRRYWWALLGLWLLITGVSLRFSLQDIHRHNLQAVTAGARNMFQMVWLARQWNASQEAVYVPITAATQPNPYLRHPRRDVSTTDGQQLTMINPAYMTRLIADISRKESQVSFHITSLRPIRPDNAPDDWERAALLEFESGTVRELSVLEPFQDGRRFRYIAPLQVGEACLKCHAHQGYKVGDVRGGISVSQSFAPFEVAAVPSIRKAVIQHISVFLLVAGLSGWALAQLRRRWLDLQYSMDELYQARNELVQSETLAGLGRMVAGFAHEINTPVGVAVGAVSQGEEALREIEALLKKEEVSEEELRAGLDTLAQASTLALANLRRAADLVRGFKRTAVDQVSEQERDFTMRDLIQDVLLALHSLLKRAPVEVRVSCPDDLTLHGVPGFYDQVLTNLVLNALQHAFAEGSRAGHLDITVGLDADGSLILVVADDGAGMNAATLAHLFEPFYTTRRALGGTGLGLYLCYSLVTNKLGGTIHCNSVLGRGSSFHITVPVDRALFLSRQQNLQPSP